MTEVAWPIFCSTAGLVMAPGFGGSVTAGGGGRGAIVTECGTGGIAALTPGALGRRLARRNPGVAQHSPLGQGREQCAISPLPTAGLATSPQTTSLKLAILAGPLHL